MDIKQMLYVLEIYKTSSFTKAAQNLYVSQPSLSLAIKRLEHELGSVIFNRSNLGVTLTPFGREYIRYITPICKQMDLLNNMLANTDIQTRRHLSVSCSHIQLAAVAFSELISKYREDDKAMFVYRESLVSDIIQQVADGSADVGLVLFSREKRSLLNDLLKNNDLEFFYLTEQSCSVVLPTTSELAAQPALDTAALRGLPQVQLYEGNLASLFSLQSDLLLGGCKVFANSRAVIRDLVPRIDGFSILTVSPQNQTYVDTSGVTCLPLRNLDITMQMGYVKKEKWPLTELAAEFIKLLCSKLTTVNDTSATL